MQQLVQAKHDTSNPLSTFLCPFCLHLDRLEKYMISTKKGYHQSMAQCPECKNKMLIRSLTSKWTPEQYADWVYPYSVDGFWQKCKYDIWKKRLYIIGWSTRFWNRYMQLKGEPKPESYEEYVQRKQKEEWEKPME